MAPAGGGASQRDFSQFVEDFLKHLFLLKIEKCTIFFSRIKFRTLGKYDGHFFSATLTGSIFESYDINVKKSPLYPYSSALIVGAKPGPERCIKRFML